MKCIRDLASACIAILVINLGTVSNALAQQTDDSPWSLSREAGLPEWLNFRGESRIRYETLDGRIRAGRTGGDQILAFRTLARLGVQRGPFRILGELIGSR